MAYRSQRKTSATKNDVCLRAVLAEVLTKESVETRPQDYPSLIIDLHAGRDRFLETAKKFLKDAKAQGEEDLG